MTFCNIYNKLVHSNKNFQIAAFESRKRSIVFNFFAYLGRMKYIERWSLMRNSYKENILEHTAEVAMIAHSLAIIANKIYGKNVDAEKLTTLALFHETGEVITGDLPTPIKYNNPELNSAYKSLELTANQKLLSMLPPELKPSYEPLLLPNVDSYERKLLKAADKIAALIKCIEETKAGNKEFVKAKKTISQDIAKMEYEEVKYFITNFLPAYEKTLDELD